MNGVQRAGAADIVDLAAFHACHTGADGRQVRPDWIRWRFTDHPLRAEAGPELWLARRQGRVVGAQAGLPVDFELAGETVRGLWAVDLMVEPAWRLRGIAPALSSALEAGWPVVAGLGISEPAAKAFARAGWRDFGRVPVWWRLLRGLPDDVAGRSVALVAAAARWPLVAADCLAKALSGCRLEPMAAFDARADAVWRAWPRAGWMVARRDRAALAWRFDRCPAAGCYRRFLLLRRGEAVGYLVLRFDEAEGLRRALLVDFLCPPGLTGALLVHAIAQARAGGADVLLCLSSAARRWFVALGFVRRPGIRLMARLQEGLGCATIVQQWYVTYADSDIDHVP